MNHEHVATVQTIYGAFGRGDVPAVQARVTDHTHWDFAGGRGEVPWHATIDGRENLPRFFELLGGGIELRAFEPREFMHCGPHVVVDVRIEYTVRKTGKRVAMDQLHWWTLDGSGKVARLRHYEDTAQVLEAVRG